MSFSFGSNATSQATPFGAAAKPSFSFGSTNTATTSTAGFGGFGTNTSSSGLGTFGSTATSTATPFGGLNTTATSAPSLFGGTGFGNTAAKPATGFGTGGFGSNTFGAQPFGTGGSTFGNTALTFGTNTLGAPAFGTGNTFSSTFSKPATSGFGGFGTGLGLGTSNAFGQPQQQQVQQQQGAISLHENCSVFGDERDQVLAKWNLLQAQWGTGKAYYSNNAPPIELNEHNPLCRFKAVGYSCISGRDDKDGHVALMFNKPEAEVKFKAVRWVTRAGCDDKDGRVALMFNKPEAEVKSNQQTLVTSLFGLLGNKPNLAVNIESIKAVSENKTQVVIYVVDKGAGGSHVSASELSTFLTGAGPRAALSGAACTAVTPVTRPAPHILAQYLQNPPPGMDIRLWKQAQADNPDPENYIPVPIIGFSEIKFRARCQAEEAALQAGFLKRATATLGELRTRRAAATARLHQLSARLASLRHTLLKVIARQEVMGRTGAPLSPEEEATRARLHELATQLAAPPLYNGRLNELLCAVRLQRSASAGAPHERYQLDPGAQEDVKQFLSMQQRGMAHLMDTVKKDLAALNIIEEGMSRLVRA